MSAVDANMRLISDCDALLAECDSYCSEASQQSSSSTILPRNAFTNSIRNWREKRRDEVLTAKHDALQPRMVNIEAQLRGVIGEVATQKDEYRNKGKALAVRLEACLEVNRHRAESTEALVVELRQVVDDITGESSVVKSMVAFNQDILRQRANEVAVNDRHLAPWAMRSSPSSSSSSSSSSRRGHNGQQQQQQEQTELTDIIEDRDHQLLDAKLKAMRAKKMEVLEQLSQALEKREMAQSILANCEEALKSLQTLARTKEGSTTSSSSSSICSGNGGGASPSSASTADKAYDHHQCESCALTHKEAEECLEMLRSLAVTESNTNTRLLSLVEARERMLDMEDLTESSSSKS